MGVVDRDVEPADAGKRAAGGDDVVEREMAALVDRLAVAQDQRIEPHPLVDREPAGHDLGQDVVELAGLGLRQEADLAEVDAEDRHVDLGDRADRAQERPVATEHDQRIGRLELVDERVDVARLELPLVDATDLAPAGRPRAQLDRRVDRRVVGEADPLDGHGAVTSAIRSPISAQPGPGARWTRNSRLPSGPVIGEAMTARVPRPMACAVGDDALEDLAVDRGVAHDAVVGPAAAGLELGLDERHDVTGRCRAERGQDRRQDQPERDERHVDRRDGDRFGKRRGRERPGVGPLHRDHPGIASERLGELSTTDIERIDPARTALEQDVGEATGRRADVEGHQTRQGRSRRRRAPRPACAPPRLTYGSAWATAIVVSAAIRSPGFRSCRAASPSPTLTAPASTSA